MFALLFVIVTTLCILTVIGVVVGVIDYYRNPQATMITRMEREQLIYDSYAARQN